MSKKPHEIDTLYHGKQNGRNRCMFVDRNLTINRIMH